MRPLVNKLGLLQRRRTTMPRVRTFEPLNQPFASHYHAPFLHDDDDESEEQQVITETLMTKEIYRKTAKYWLKSLQAPGDATPRFMAAGTGPPFATCDNIRDALKTHPKATPVRGYRILFVRLQDDDWVVKAVFHVVLSHASKDPAVPDRYECVTDHYNDVGDAKNGFLFVPSSRAHANLTDDEILSGKWCFGTVLIGCDAFCEWLISHMQVQGRMKSIVGRSPEVFFLAP